MAAPSACRRRITPFGREDRPLPRRRDLRWSGLTRRASPRTVTQPFFAALLACLRDRDLGSAVAQVAGAVVENVQLSAAPAVS